MTAELTPVDPAPGPDHGSQDERPATAQVEDALLKAIDESMATLAQAEAAVSTLDEQINEVSTAGWRIFTPIGFAKLRRLQRSSELVYEKHNRAMESFWRLMEEVPRIAFELQSQYLSEIHQLEQIDLPSEKRDTLTAHIAKVTATLEKVQRASAEALSGRELRRLELKLLLRRGKRLYALLITAIAGTWLCLFAVITSTFARLYATNAPARLLSFVRYGGMHAGVTGAAVVALIGAGLYYVRSNYRRVYAVTELGFAVATAFASIIKLQTVVAEKRDDVGVWIPIAGAMYLVVRGLDNFAEGSKQAKAERLKLAEREAVESSAQAAAGSPPASVPAAPAEGSAEPAAPAMSKDEGSNRGSPAPAP